MTLNDPNPGFKATVLLCKGEYFKTILIGCSFKLRSKSERKRIGQKTEDGTVET